MIGGHLPTPKSASLTISNPVMQDDYTWCVQKAKYFPMIFNWFLGMSPGCWIAMIFGVGYGSAFLFYILFQFDSKDTRYEDRDFHYALFFVTLPAVTGMNQRFSLKSMLPRAYFVLLVQLCFVYWQVAFFQIIRR